MASEGEWSIFVGILIFIVGIIIATYYYLQYKKIFLIVFTTSVSLYVFSIFYIWDVFELNKNIVLLLLIFSTILMFITGKYFSKIKLKKDKIHTSLKEKNEEQ
jgi:uncharacterized membrane protein